MAKKIRYRNSKEPMKIVSYCDRFSVRPGQTIRYVVSSEAPAYRAEFVRLRHTEANPSGPASNAKRSRPPSVANTRAATGHPQRLICDSAAPTFVELPRRLYPAGVDLSHHAAKGPARAACQVFQPRPVGLRPLYRRGRLAGPVGSGLGSGWRKCAPASGCRRLNGTTSPLSYAVASRTKTPTTTSPASPRTCCAVLRRTPRPRRDLLWRTNAP